MTTKNSESGNLLHFPKNFFIHLNITKEAKKIQG